MWEKARQGLDDFTSEGSEKSNFKSRLTKAVDRPHLSKGKSFTKEVICLADNYLPARNLSPCKVTFCRAPLSSICL